VQVSTVDIREAIVRFLVANAAIIQFISYVASPILALIAFWLNRRDRKEIIAQTRANERAQANLEQAQKLAAQKQAEIDSALKELAQKGSEVEKLRSDLRSITEGSQELWKLRPAKAFPEYFTWLRDPAGAKLITFGNLKGGVGKTTLAANFAAYLSHTRNKPVLLVDLDYQGSLSNMLMLAAGKEEVESRVDWLFDENAGLATVDRAAEHLAPKLSRAWLVPANYTFAQIENGLLLRWLLQEDGGLDVRFRLAHALLSPEIRRKYAAIIFDMPPRMTLGSLNAVVASHYFVVPTVLDKLSVEAVGQFLTNVRAIKGDLKLDIDLAGVAGVMTRAINLSPTEQEALERAREGGAIWVKTATMFSRLLCRDAWTLPMQQAEILPISVMTTMARWPSLFDPLFEEICTAVWKGDGP